ncbi:acyl-CoA dehydrogenase family protein [Mycobacterium vicinigordonae]|uniref:Acyl-CoA dehydrogenase family protein n=1 Tax=Mycobacterium vicinigordonae TaxID=1719132 RepID=A0A7D6E1M0_9MYCO|nr:acyl-CoA dehydrogenase family protein [Mycobacterium vicinigordonae]QLL08730.1 acyl-CoA dehydrogenase family protein [Mycobacterium vicinigordonae]
MHAVDDSGLRSFRDEARTWLHENVPTEPRPQGDSAARQYDCAWQRRQFDGGWAGVAWPRSFGGRGLSPLQQVIWIEEMVRADAPGMGSFTVALGHAGPTIIHHGDSEQQQTYLPSILKGESPWCQGFSEPNSGSDLASLRTAALLDGDHFVVNGQKKWTSFAAIADFQELLVRTDPHAPKHQGISWLIVDMHSPGITVRPITTLDGQAEFADVFYDEVRVPLKNVVGGLNQGWKVAMTTLGFERGTGYLANRLRLRNDVDKLIDEARARGALKDDRIAFELANIRAEATAVQALGYEGVTSDAQVDLLACVNQVFHAELAKRLHRAALEVIGNDALVRNDTTTRYFTSLPETILGGTKDIQKNILGERVLGLPR